MRYSAYKDFIIENDTTRYGGKQYSIYSPEGHWIQNFNTQQECIKWIDIQVNSEK